MDILAGKMLVVTAKDFVWRWFRSMKYLTYVTSSDRLCAMMTFFWGFPPHCCRRHRTGSSACERKEINTAMAKREHDKTVCRAYIFHYHNWYILIAHLQ